MVHGGAPRRIVFRRESEESSFTGEGDVDGSKSRAVTGGPARGDYVLWVSTSRTTRGGVSSVVNTMLDTGLSDAWHVVHVATHRDGGPLRKIVAFVVGSLHYLRLVLFRRPRLVHIHSASYGSFVRKSSLVWVARALRIPVIIHVHGAEFHIFFGSLPRPLRAYVSATLSTCQAVIALGPGWAARIIEIAPRARVIVIPNSVHPHESVTQPGVGAPVRVLFLGRIGERKGAFDLIEAWHALLACVDDRAAHLTVAGDGEIERARRMIADLGIGTSVDVPGWIDPSAVPDLIAEAQILVLPSYDEGQPMALLEAMAAGLCIVTSPVGGIPDLVDTTCALFVTPGDIEALSSALEHVVTDVERRESLGRAARARAQATFDVDVVWRRLDVLYTELAR